MSFGSFIAWPLETLNSDLMTIQKDLHAYLLLYQSLYDFTNPIGCNLIQPLILPMHLATPLYQSLVLPIHLAPALILTSYFKCQTILLILLCMAVPFFAGMFLFSIDYYLCNLLMHACILNNYTHEENRSLYCNSMDGS